MSDYTDNAWEVVAEKTAEIERLRAENQMLDGMAKLHERLKDEALQAWTQQQREIERLRAALEDARDGFANIRDLNSHGASDQTYIGWLHSNAAAGFARVRAALVNAR